MNIKKIELDTPDLLAAKNFYNGVLGFPVKQNSDVFISFSVGQSELQFNYRQNTDAYYHFAFLVPSNQFEDSFNWLSCRHKPLHYSLEKFIADFDNWNAQAFYFHDPQKNILEFIAHYDLANNFQNPFSTQSIFGLCEIGVTVDYVREECEDLHEELAIPYYKKGPLLDDFAVMGDEQGLLIISKKGRGWLPTGQASERFPLKIHLLIDGKEELLSYS